MLMNTRHVTRRALGALNVIPAATPTVMPAAALTWVAAAVLMAIPLTVSSAAAQAPDFHSEAAIPAGATLRVVTVSGDVNVQASPDDSARVRGWIRAGSGDDVDKIRFEVVRDGQDVTICALDRDSWCDKEGLHRDRDDHWDDDDRDAHVDFMVEVPAGVVLSVGSRNGDVRVRGATAAVHATSGNGEVSVGPGAGRVTAASGNGDVEVDGAHGPVEASSGNGDVAVSTTRGPANASTGNGRVFVRMASLPEEGDMSFSSGNGEIVLALPDDFAGTIEATTGNGGLDSEFPMMLDGRIGHGHFRGTIGEGGWDIDISTGNGSIELRRYGT